MKSVIAAALILSAPFASAAETKWNQLYYVYCGYESTETYLTWYWRPDRVERDMAQLQNACRLRNQSDQIIVVPST